MATTLTFTLRKAISSDLRCGTLTLVKPERTITLETPNCLAYTVLGTVPHLTPDNLRLLPCEAVQITLESLFEERNPSSLRYSGGLHKFLYMEPYLLYTDLRDPAGHRPTSINTDKFVSITTHGGVRQVTPTMFNEVADAYRPDVLASLADVVCEEQPSLKRVRKSVDRTAKWLDTAVKGKKENTHIFAVLVGSHIKEERIRSATLAAAQEVEGFVLSGHGLGETAQERAEHLKVSILQLPEQKPRIAYGFGRPEEILVAVANGLDLFDSSYVNTTTDAGHAFVFQFPPTFAADSIDTQPKTISLWDPSQERDFRPFLEGCECYACRNHTRAYVYHLLKTHEMLASVLLMGHNMHHYSTFFRRVRASINAGTFEHDAAAFKQCYNTKEDYIVLTDAQLKESWDPLLHGVVPPSKIKMPLVL